MILPAVLLAGFIIAGAWAGYRDMSVFLQFVQFEIILLRS